MRWRVREPGIIFRPAHTSIFEMLTTLLLPTLLYLSPPEPDSPTPVESAASPPSEAAPIADPFGPEVGWYVEVAGTSVGPISEAEVRQRLTRGEIDGSTPVWREGLAEWVALESLDEFADARPSTPPPIGPARGEGDAGPASTDRTPGWALGGGIAALGLMAPVLGLGIAAEITSDEQIPAIPLGAAATVILATATPIAFAAGASARRASGVRGSLGLRIAGWVTYGLALSNAVALIGLGANEIQPYPGAISVTTVFGVSSGVMMASDALISHRQASQAIRRNASKGGRWQLAVGRPAMGTGATLGFGGRF